MALYSYAEVQQHRQDEIFQQLKLPRSFAKQDVPELAKTLIQEMANHSL